MREDQSRQLFQGNYYHPTFVVGGINTAGTAFRNSAKVYQAALSHIAYINQKYNRGYGTSSKEIEEVSDKIFKLINVAQKEIEKSEEVDPAIFSLDRISFTTAFYNFSSAQKIFDPLAEDYWEKVEKMTIWLCQKTMEKIDSEYIYTPSSEEKNVVVVDGNWLLQRVWHSKAQDKVSNFIERAMAFTHTGRGRVVFVFDSGKSEARVAMNKDYKGTRSAKEPELYEFFDACKKELDKRGFLSISEKGVEGDDVAALVSKKYADDEHQVTLVTVDKDWLSLVSENVTVMRCDKNYNFIENNIDNFAELNDGLNPYQYELYLSLNGDVSDNIPGVAGFGEVKAKAYAKQCDSIEDLLFMLPEKKDEILYSYQQVKLDGSHCSLDVNEILGKK